MKSRGPERVRVAAGIVGAGPGLQCRAVLVPAD